MGLGKHSGAMSVWRSGRDQSTYSQNCVGMFKGDCRSERDWSTACAGRGGIILRRIGQGVWSRVSAGKGGISQYRLENWVGLLECLPEWAGLVRNDCIIYPRTLTPWPSAKKRLVNLGLNLYMKVPKKVPCVTSDSQKNTSIPGFKSCSDFPDMI